MTSLFSTVFIVFSYILIGFLIKKTNIVSDNISKLYNFISFNIFLPLALITNFWNITFPKLIINELIITFFSAGIIVFILGFFFSKKFFYFKTDDSALFGLGACFGNSVAFGIPLMYSILGPVNVMPYMILVLFHGLIHFTYTTLIIEGYRNRKLPGLKLLSKTILGLLKNIVLFGMFVGIFLNISNISMPNAISFVLTPVSKIALPSVLISLGITIGGFNIIHNLSHSLVLTSLKNFIHPVIAFLIAKYIFSMPQLLIVIVTMASALPSGSQTYYFSYRYKSLQQTITSNIVLSTFTSFFTLSFLIIIFGY
jgi:malonate transporter and related proteins